MFVGVYLRGMGPMFTVPPGLAAGCGIGDTIPRKLRGYIEDVNVPYAPQQAFIDKLQGTAVVSALQVTQKGHAKARRPKNRYWLVPRAR